MHMQSLLSLEQKIVCAWFQRLEHSYHHVCSAWSNFTAANGTATSCTITNHSV